MTKQIKIMTTNQIAKLIKNHYFIKMELNVEQDYHEDAIYYYGENKEGKFIGNYYYGDHIFSIIIQETSMVVVYNNQYTYLSTKNITEDKLIKHLNRIFYVEQQSPLRLRRDYILSQILMD